MDFDNTIFKNSKAEDFLNITHTKFKIEKSSFMNCVSDALDSDFSNGRIISSEFSNIDGDAVDFSGSKVEVLENKFNLIKDKSISAGEISKIDSENNHFLNSSIAITSKDKSIVTTKNDKFENSILYDVAAFNKKSFYKVGGQVFIKDDKYNIDLKMKSDLLSKIFINGRAIKNEKFDISEIYSK